MTTRLAFAAAVFTAHAAVNVLTWSLGTDIRFCAGSVIGAGLALCIAGLAMPDKGEPK